MPITALRFCDTGLAAENPELNEPIHDLAALCCSSLGKLARAYRHERELKVDPEGAKSKYWIGAYIQFQQPLQRSTQLEAYLMPQ